MSLSTKVKKISDQLENAEPEFKRQMEGFLEVVNPFK